MWSEVVWWNTLSVNPINSHKFHFSIHNVTKLPNSMIEEHQLKIIHNWLIWYNLKYFSTQQLFWSVYATYYLCAIALNWPPLVLSENLHSEEWKVDTEWTNYCKAGSGPDQLEILMETQHGWRYTCTVAQDITWQSIPWGRSMVLKILPQIVSKI